MNKDVIYIEAEDDITDILSKIKNAKTKIVALVPPKKAGVLRSAVNFKLITKTADKAEKTVVLVSSDASLLRLAAAVNIPVAKTLQSKPRLVEDRDATEFGDDTESDDLIEAEPNDTASTSTKIEVKHINKESVKASKKQSDDNAHESKTLPVREAKTEDDIIEEEKPSRRNINQKVPNFKKYQKPIIFGTLACFALVAFLVWAFIFAPAANIVVDVKTTENGFAEKLTLVSAEDREDIDKGILFVESKTITKSAEANFEATGERDDGTKATGYVVVTRPKGENITTSNQNFSIPKGTVFTIEGKKYSTTQAASINLTKEDTSGVFLDTTHPLKESKSSGNIPVIAAENGDSYNIAAVSSGITSSSVPAKYKITSSAMTGGLTKHVKIVSSNDVANAESGLNMDVEDEARDDLAKEFGDEYLLIKSSFSSDSGKITTSPAVNEVVGDGVKPKIVKEVKYTIFAIKRADAERYIKKIAEATMLGDDTQMVYDSGVKDAFIDGFKETENKQHSGKLKTTVKTGPKITKEIVMEKALGKKVGEVKTMIESIKGVKSTSIKTSYFWVTSVPNDQNRVNIEIKSSDES